ncbi:MAG: site-specific DNA-methyltransferase [Muribaculaceae bacterium]|nr:site-specific DNA-methyltransferase [Muribaculaceae bacterium]
MIIEHLDKITLVNGDCLEFMQGEPDLSYDLAIVDPPYGIDAGSYKRGGTKEGNQLATCKEYHTGDWDKLPPPTRLFCRIAKS